MGFLFSRLDLVFHVLECLEFRPVKLVKLEMFHLVFVYSRSCSGYRAFCLGRIHSFHLSMEDRERKRNCRSVTCLRFMMELGRSVACVHM